MGLLQITTKEAYQEMLGRIHANDPTVYAITTSFSEALTPDDIESLAAALKNNSYLTRIDFSNNDITDESVALLATFRLERLRVKSNSISKESIKKLAQHPTLTHLKIESDKSFFDSECAELFIKNNRIIELETNPKSDESSLLDLTVHISENKSCGLKLIYEAGKGNKERVHQLLREGAYIESKDDVGNTALISACWHQQEETVKVLIAQRANVNARNYRISTSLLGDTPLHAVAKKGNEVLVKLLLSQGANKNLLDLYGRTPAQVAKAHGYGELATFLEGYKPKPKGNSSNLIQSSIYKKLANLMLLSVNSVKKNLNKNIVLVLGNTDAGKSTLVDYLTGCKMELKRNKETKREEARIVEGKEVAKIGNDPGTSETFYPGIYDSKEGYAYCDCPGFMESKGADYEACTMMSTRLAIKSANSVEGILVAINYYHLYHDRALLLKNLVTTFISLLDNPETHKNSIYFIVTKAPVDAKEQDIINVLKMIIKSHKNLLDNSTTQAHEYTQLEKELKVLEFMLDRIILGNIFDNGRTRNRIVSALNRAVPIKKTKFKYELRDNKRRLLDEVVDDIVNAGRALFRDRAEKHEQVSNLEKEISSLEQRREKHQANLAELKANKPVSLEDLLAPCNNQIKELKEDIKRAWSNIQAKQEAIEKAESEIKELDLDDRTFFDLDGKYSVNEKRAFFAFFGRTIRQWEYEEKIPYLDVEKTASYGSFRDERKDPAKGEYKVTYDSGLYRHGIANLKFYVRKGDLPEVRKQIDTLKKDIENLQLQIAELKDAIIGFEKDIEEIMGGESLNQTGMTIHEITRNYEDKEKQIKDLEEEIVKLNNLILETRKELKSAQEAALEVEKKINLEIPYFDMVCEELYPIFYANDLVIPSFIEEYNKLLTATATLSFSSKNYPYPNQIQTVHVIGEFNNWLKDDGKRSVADTIILDNWLLTPVSSGNETAPLIWKKGIDLLLKTKAYEYQFLINKETLWPQEPNSRLNFTLDVNVTGDRITDAPKIDELLLPQATLEATPLHDAISNTDYPLVESLLKEAKIDVNVRGPQGFTPLHYAAKKVATEAAKEGEVKIINLLLSKKAQIDCIDRYGRTPLFFASANNKLHVVKLLVEKNASTLKANVDGNTPLHIAAENGHEEVVKFLLESKASCFVRNKNGDTPLHLAAKSAKIPVLNILKVKASVSCFSPNHGSLSPFHLALISQDDKTKPAEVFESLIDLFVQKSSFSLRSGIIRNGELGNFKDKDGNTLLHTAASLGQDAVVKQLLDDKMLSINILSNNGDTALHLAVEKGHKEAILILLRNNARMEIKNKLGKSVFDIAKDKLKEAQSKNSNIDKFTEINNSIIQAKQEKFIQVILSGISSLSSPMFSWIRLDKSLSLEQNGVAEALRTSQPFLQCVEKYEWFQLMEFSNYLSDSLDKALKELSAKDKDILISTTTANLENAIKELLAALEPNVFPIPLGPEPSTLFPTLELIGKEKEFSMLLMEKLRKSYYIAESILENTVRRKLEKGDKTALTIKELGEMAQNAGGGIGGISGAVASGISGPSSAVAIGAGIGISLFGNVLGYASNAIGNAIEGNLDEKAKIISTNIVKAFKDQKGSRLNEEKLVEVVRRITFRYRDQINELLDTKNIEIFVMCISGRIITHISEGKNFYTDEASTWLGRKAQGCINFLKENFISSYIPQAELDIVTRCLIAIEQETIGRKTKLETVTPRTGAQQWEAAGIIEKTGAKAFESRKYSYYTASDKQPAIYGFYYISPSEISRVEEKLEKSAGMPDIFFSPTPAPLTPASNFFPKALPKNNTERNKNTLTYA